MMLDGPEQSSCESDKATKQIESQTDPSTSHEKAKFGASIGIHQLFKMLGNAGGSSKSPHAVNSLNTLGKPRQYRCSTRAVDFLHKKHFNLSAE
jgi:hypothetical protein